MAAPNSLVASAEVLTGQRYQDPGKQRKPWQEEAWQFYDESGPLRYATNWLSNLISRARLQAATLTPDGDEPEPLDDGEVAEAVQSLAGGINGQSQMLRSSVVDLTIPGIGYLVGVGENTQEWRMYSADVLRIRVPATDNQSAVYQLKTDKETWSDLPSGSLVVKVWRPHERLYWEPDSPTRAALPSLRELRRINQYIEATLVSRLAGAGILILPAEATFPVVHNTQSAQADPAKDPFITEMLEVMVMAVQRPGTAAQIVPIPIKVPAQYADAVRHISFTTELSDKILDMRESALRQCAITLDVPAEVLTGMGDLNHWGAWQIEESAVKVHAEPLLELICSSLTTGFLHPVLKAQGMGDDEVSQYVVWADTSELSSKPDKSDDAIALYDRGELSSEALRRETGLSDADKPAAKDIEEWGFKKLVGQPVNAAVGLEGLGVEVPESSTPVLPLTPVSSNGNGEPVEDEEAVASEGPPATQDQFRAEILVLESYVHRALERAGNRLRSTARHQLQDCDASPHVCMGGVKGDIDRLLEGAWDRLPSVLVELNMDAAVTVERLQSFCRTLLEQGLEYERRSLVSLVHTVKVAA